MIKNLLFVASLIVMNGAIAQIVRVDVNQTVTSNSPYELDMDMDGVVDFKIKIEEHVEPGGGSHTDAEIEAEHDEAFFAYDIITNGTDTVLIAKMLNLNENPGLYWATMQHGYLALPEDGYQGFAGAGDKYVSLLKDHGGHNHYGWVLINVSADASSILVKAFGYNRSHNNLVVNAGQFDNNVTSIESNNSQVTIYNAGKQLFVKNKSGHFTQLNIFDLSGKLVQSLAIGNTHAQIDCSFLSGVYIVQSNINGQIKNTKMIF
jgi:hypothetical protein